MPVARLRPVRAAAPYGPRRRGNNVARLDRRRTLAAVAALATAVLGAGILAPGPASADDTVRIVALGDSLTAGYGLPQGEGFVPQLEAWLHDNGAPQADVVDAGVSGDTTAGGRSRLDWALADGADAVIVALGGNDLLRGVPPEEARANLDAILTELGERGLPAILAGLPAPNNYGPDYKRRFDALYQDLAEAHGAILYPNFMKGIGPGSDLLQDDGLHPSAEGVRAMVRNIGPSVLTLIAKAEAARA